MTEQVRNEVQERVEKTWNTLRHRISEIVTKAVNNPPAEVDENLLLAAQYEFDHGYPTHQCYWNGRFCIAVTLGLPWETQRKAAWCVLNNGLTNYWEWWTHDGFEMAQTLRRLGIEVEGPSKEHDQGYCRLGGSVSVQIAEYFDLPSKLLRPYLEIGDDELRREQKNLWSDYHHSQSEKTLR